MKESVLDVLIYLFDHYIEQEQDYRPDQDSLRNYLKQAGFEEQQVEKAFDWLEGLSIQQKDAASINNCSEHNFRVFTEQERAKINRDCRSLLLFLEQAGVLGADDREFVIDRIMALGTDEIDLEQLKWVVLMVLLNQPGKEAAYVWMEDIVMEDGNRLLH